MKIPLLDLTRKYREIESELRSRWDEALASMRLLNGPNLAGVRARVWPVPGRENTPSASPPAPTPFNYRSPRWV
jgi:hypothetical protein